ncbi:MAG: ribosome maturation factor RimP [Kineosporiaceae bacterium]|nr:ribosome maturation factor RimP [Aeromicrobium sp.]
MTDRLDTLVAGCVSELGFDLEAIELTPAGKKRVLRIAIDQDGGVTIDDISSATRAISAELDDTDVMGTMPYTLEVTSRGLDSPLKLARHWRRNNDRLVSAQLADGSTVDGRLGDSDGDGVDISTAQGVQRIAYADVTKALVQIELKRKNG